MSERRGIALALAALVLAGCSPSYRGERYLWRAERLLQPILESPLTATGENVRLAADALGVVTQKAPGTPAAARAQLLLGHLFAARRSFDEALDAYETVKRNHPEDRRTVAQAMRAMAGVEIARGRWPDAARRYREIAERFPWSGIGMEAPLLAAQALERAADPEMKSEGWREAVLWYEDHVNNTPAPELAIAMKGFLATAYQADAQWEKAAAVLEELSKPDTKGVNRSKALYHLALLQGSRLNQPERERELLNEVRIAYPGDPYGRAAAARLAQLEADGRQPAGEAATPTVAP